MMVTYIAANGNSGRLQKIAFKEAPVGRVAATQPHNVSYTFDDAGNPTKGVVDTGTTTIYSSNHRNQYDSVGTDSVSNGNFHEMKSYQAITYCYINDALFDKVTDVRGNNYTLTYDAPPGQTPILEYYRYDVFGQPAIYGPDNQVRQASLYSNRFLFTGREYNANFGFYEYRARAYHPSLGRFMSEDPKLFDAGDYNLFRYCHNDPVDNVDPMGLEENLAQKPISAWDPTGRAWLKQFRDGVQEVLRQIARQQAYAEAYGWSGHGAIGIGMANEQIGQLQNAVGGVMRALGFGKSDPCAPSAISWREAPGRYVEPTHDSHGNPLWVAHVPRTLQLLDEHNKPTFGAGIRVDEAIAYSNGVKFHPSGTETRGFWTGPNGTVSDPWKLPFTAPTGRVTTTQTLSVLGHQAQLSVTVRISPDREIEVSGEYWAPFH